MNASVRQLLNDFDGLSPAEKYEATAELLRRTLEQASPELSDEAFAEAAESLFLDLDAREADDART